MTENDVGEYDGPETKRSFEAAREFFAVKAPGLPKVSKKSLSRLAGVNPRMMPGMGTSMPMAGGAPSPMGY